MIDNIPISGNDKKSSFYNAIFKHELISDYCDRLAEEIIFNYDDDEDDVYLTSGDITNVLQKRIITLQKGKLKFIKESSEGVVFTENEINYWTNSVDIIINELNELTKLF